MHFSSGVDTRTIGAEGDGINSAIVPFEGADCLTRRGVPQAGGPVE
jgi:hypothetical protein